MGTLRSMGHGGREPHRDTGEQGSGSVCRRKSWEDQVLVSDEQIGK